MNYWNIFRDKQVPSSSKETRTRPKINSRILHNKWASFQWWSSWQRTRHALEIVDSLGIWFIGSAHFSLTVTPRSIIIYVTDWNNFADNLSLSFPPPPFVNNIPQQPIYSNNPSQQRSTALFFAKLLRKYKFSLVGKIFIFLLSRRKERCNNRECLQDDTFLPRFRSVQETLFPCD